MVTVIKENHSGLMPYAQRSTKGMMSALAKIGGTGASHLYFRNFRVKTTPIKVARLPKTISGIAAPVSILASRHPMNKPGIAAGVK